MAKHEGKNTSKVAIESMARNLGLTVRREAVLDRGERVWVITDGSLDGTIDLPNKAQVEQHLKNLTKVSQAAQPES
jgi:hypothetical protein